MTAEQFEQTLLQFLRRRPFEPFVVELFDGRVIEIPAPKVVVGGGAATWVGDDFDHTDFDFKDVRAIRPQGDSGATSDEGCSHMTAKQFDQTLRQFHNREPFEPFVVEMLDGRLIEVHSPNVAFCDGAASFFTADSEFVQLVCEEVRAIRPAFQGAAS